MYNKTKNLKKNNGISKIVFLFSLLLLAVVLLIENKNLIDIMYVGMLFIFLFRFVIMKLYQ